jgi:hypothetical protein
VPRTAGGWVSGKDLAQAQYPQMRPLRVYTLPGTDSPRVSMVTDSINPGNLYGGVGTAILLTCLLAQARGGRARIITRVHEAAPAALANLLSTYGIKLGHEVEFVFAHHDSPREFDILADELFVTTSWWTTAATLGSIPGQRVIYLLQEDERMFYPWGDGHRRCASVLASHEPRYAINSRLLYDHLVASGLGHLRERGTWFEPAFPPSVFHPRQPLHADRRTLMFYARPLNERNLFYFGLEILEKALATGVLDPDAWRIVFVGKDIPEVRLLGGTVTVQRMENLGWSDYAALVGSVDLGLSLMYTPHPSYPPLDLAASGAVAVTNRCGNKQDLSAYSRNIVCGDMELDAMVEALREGVRLACNAQERAANHAQIRFATDWKQALQPLVEQFRSAG